MIRKREDNYHDLETLFYPIPWVDVLEILVSPDDHQPFSFTSSGIEIGGPLENNLIYKAWSLLRESVSIPSLRVHLHKNIPMGAGLGGGSADAAFFIRGVNSKFNLGFSDTQLLELAGKLGSDCPFFINNKPCLAEGRGEILREFDIDISGFYLLVVYPGIHSTTAQAFRQLEPKKPGHPLSEILTLPLNQWKDLLINDFEKSIFSEHPVIGQIKETMYKKGALYASLSGSGSAVYGLFSEIPQWPKTEGQLTFIGRPS